MERKEQERGSCSYWTGGQPERPTGVCLLVEASGVLEKLWYSVCSLQRLGKPALYICDPGQLIPAQCVVLEDAGNENVCDGHHLCLWFLSA